jgi:hypothetical protein
MKAIRLGTKNDMFPVMLFSPQGRLISANLTAQPLLHHWNCRIGHSPNPQDQTIGKALLDAITGMQATTIEVPFSGLKLFFDVEPFAEAGYTGLYGFHIESIMPEHIIQKFRLKC